MEDRNTPRSQNLYRKACNGILPTCQNLGKRIKNARVECAICGWELERDRHIFFDCERAKSVWKEIGREEILKNVSVNSFRDWLEYIMETHSKAEVEYLVIIIWMIWKNRSGLILGRKDWKPEQTKTYAHGLISDFQTYQLKLPDRSEDGARIGMVVRDHRGQVEAVMVEFIPQSFDSEHVETLAFLKAFAVCQRLWNLPF